jgi:uncharacterized protein YbjQ (UPF0145 family)
MLKRHSISSKSASTSNATSKNDIPACYSDTHGIITSTTNTIPQHRITKNLGTIFGLTCQSRNWGAEIGGLLKSSVGGELQVFTKMMYTARNEAMDRMVGECMGRGGNAVVGLRFDVASEGGWCQICAYGTAVFVQKVEGEEGRGGVVVEEDEGVGSGL